MMERIIAFVLVSAFVCQITYADMYRWCVGSNFNYTDGGLYQSNLNLLLTDLKSKSSDVKFDSHTVGSDFNQVYGLFQCRNDIRLDHCEGCVKNASKVIITECPLYGEAVVWFEECMLRYSDRNIFSLMETSPSYHVWNTVHISSYTEFTPMFRTTMWEIIEDASSSSPHFDSAIAGWSPSERFYSYAQCTPDIGEVFCYACLEKALNLMIDCCKSYEGVAIYMPSCQLRFETYPILIDTNSPAIKTKKTSSTMITVIAACAAVGLIVIAVVLWICICRKKRDKAATAGIAPASPTGPWESSHKLGGSEFIQYDFATLKIATKNFATESKLGEGGFGKVYKGTLNNGDELAIKRLTGTSAQGTQEFMVEAGLLAKLQHKNLVNLLGFCMEGDEKLLVYEFMSNSSLDAFLFDPEKRHLLSWVIRHKIIMGIARGLQYLHEDSRLTIIHRDLKPSNILLDKELNPKIADFGLAKLFEGAQKTGNTHRIAGTMGYMAPEYLQTGEYSDKSDVYSFGIMLMEIVSGQNNKNFYQSQYKEDLPVHVWRLWNVRRSLELTDPILLDNCPANDVMRCIQIGLLCLQANAVQRPTMASVTFMLTGSVDLPLPSAPAMSFPQFNMPMDYSGRQQSDNMQFSSNSITQELPFKPR